MNKNNCKYQLPHIFDEDLFNIIENPSTTWTFALYYVSCPLRGSHDSCKGSGQNCHHLVPVVGVQSITNAR